MNSNAFLTILAALFLEFWKRYSAEIAHRWDVQTYQPEEEHPRPEYLAQLNNVEEKTVNFVTQTTEPKVSRSLLNTFSVDRVRKLKCRLLKLLLQIETWDTL